MTADTAIFVQSALNRTRLQQQQNWRIFSKLGAGYSTSRNRGEIITTAHVCLPATVDTNSSFPVKAAALEFSLSVRGSVLGDTSLQAAQARVLAATQTIVRNIVKGNIT